MKRQISLALVSGGLIILSFSAGCRSDYGWGGLRGASVKPRLFSARVNHGPVVRDRLMPFSISGTRRYQTVADSQAVDPLKRTNESLAAVLGPDNELAQAIANRPKVDWHLQPFALAPLTAPIQPDSVTAEEVVESPQVAQQPELPEVVPSDSFGEKASVDHELVEAVELPASEPFMASVSPVDDSSESAFTKSEGKQDVVISRLREARIQQLLDLLAKAEEQASADVPPLPPAPIIEQAKEPEVKEAEPQIIPHKLEEPKEIVLRATATMPYQSVRNERVELLNVQQLAPTIPARPGVPAIVQGAPAAELHPRGWANRDWSKELLPDFSALGEAAPEVIQFTPLPAADLPAVDGNQAAAATPQEPGQSVGRIVPELDTNPATAARPLQKSSDRR
jgi:hypothetical protein